MGRRECRVRWRSTRPAASAGRARCADPMARPPTDGADRAQTSATRLQMKEPAMAASRNVIITCAVTGSIHTPSMSPYLPVTPQEIADAAVGAAEAGAAIVHLHARDPVDGHPTQDPAVFKQFLPKIKAASDVVVNLTTGGAPTM